jgi:hypothetical protein
MYSKIEPITGIFLTTSAMTGDTKADEMRITARITTAAVLTNVLFIYRYPLLLALLFPSKELKILSNASSDGYWSFAVWNRDFANCSSN